MEKHGKTLHVSPFPRRGATARHLLQQALGLTLLLDDLLELGVLLEAI